MAFTYFRVLEKYQTDLESSLNGVDLIKLSRDLLKNRVLSKDSSDKFAALDTDPDHLEQEVKVRYLLKLVYERVREDENIFGRVVKILSRLGGELDAVCQVIRKKIADCKNEDGLDCSGLKQSTDVFFTVKDVPFLVDLIVAGSHKWEEIGVALGVPEYVREECRSAGSNPLKLSKLLSAWISGKYKDAKTTTLNSLKTVLEGGLVKLPDVAQNLDTFSSPLEHPPSSLPSTSSEDVPTIDYQSYDIEVAEGKSTLLEVQLSSSSGCEAYQWSKDGEPLLDGVDFCGVCSNMLYIHKSSSCSEGKYSCCVSRGSESVCSDEMSLSVIYPPEKVELLKFYSLMEREVPQDSWPPVGNSTFVNLVLIEQKPMSTCDYYTIRGDMDDILESKEVAEYEEVFREYREGALVLVEGRPGSGKTTLVHKLTKDWASGKKVLRGAKMVFLVTLKLLNVSDKDKSLLDLLQIFYSDALSKNIEHDLLECRGKGACFILDGLDEYPIHSKKQLIVDELINIKKLFPHSMVIVASRPVGTRNLKTSCKIRIEVIGFSKGQIYSYVGSYPFKDSSTSMACKMTEFLDQHPNVLHMCYLPVHASMICFLFSQLEGKIPHTETKIYEQFTIATLLRHKAHREKEVSLRSLEDVSGEEKELFDSVCKLAFDMTVNSQQVVSKSDAKIVLSDDSVLGLLTVEHTCGHYGSEEFYTFHHLTFQEFLAAFYLHSLQSRDEDLLKTNSLLNVWKYYCGLGGADIEFFKKIPIMYPFSLLYKAQCAFESQVIELCDSIIEEGVLKFDGGIISSTDFIAFGYIMSKSTKLVEKIVLDRCVWDSEGVKVFASMAGKVKLSCIRHLKVLINKDDTFKALNTLLNHLPLLEELDLERVVLTKARIVSLTEEVALPHLQTIKITLPLQLIDSSHPEETLKLLAFKSRNIKQMLYFVERDHDVNHVVWKKLLQYTCSYQAIQDSNLSWIHLYNTDTIYSIAHERFSHCTEVVLVNCCIGDEGAEILANTLNTSVLENLVLDFNRIRDSGAVALAGCLARCSVVQEVSIQCNCIGDSGAIALADALVHCSSLRRLDLQGNSLGDKGAVAIAKATENLTSLELFVHNVNITEEGIEKVLELRPRTRVRHMVFTSTWDCVSEADIDTLRSALYCENLPLFKLSDNNIYSFEKLLAEHEHLRSIAGLKSGWIKDDIVPTLCSIMKQLTSLRHIEIYVDDINLTNAELLSGSLKACKSLRSLVFTSIVDPVWPCLLDAVKCFTGLHSLNLSSSLKCSTNVNYLFSNPDFTVNLHTLSLCRNRLNSEGIRLLFTNPDSWGNLHALDLFANGIDASGAQVLGQALVHCKKLRSLNLYGNKLDDNAAVAIAEGLKDHTSLQQLRFGSNHVELVGMAALIPVIKKNRIKHLDLQNFLIGPKCAADLVDALSGDSLQILDIGSTGLRANGIASLSAGLMKFSQLNQLHVSGTMMMNKGVVHLAEGLKHCTNLQTLNINNNYITSEGVPSLHEIMRSCKHLKEFSLTFNTIGIEGAAVLIGGWQHKSMLTMTLSGCIGKPHEKALEDLEKCCSNCDDFLELYYNNDYLHIQLRFHACLPKLIRPINKCV